MMGKPANSLRSSPVGRRVDSGQKLLEVPLVQALPRRVRAAVVDRTRFRPFRRGDVAAWEGVALGHLPIVIDGFLKLSVRRLDGRSKVMGVVGPGASPCWSDAITGRPLPASLVGLQEGVVAELPLGPIQYGVTAHARFAFMYAEELAKWTTSLQEQLVSTRAASVPERLAGLLGYLIDHCGDPKTGVIPANLSRQELAEAAGTTAETTIRLLRKWEKAGQVEKTAAGGLRIPDRQWLQRMTDGAD